MLMPEGGPGSMGPTASLADEWGEMFVTPARSAHCAEALPQSSSRAAPYRSCWGKRFMVRFPS